MAAPPDKAAPAANAREASGLINEDEVVGFAAKFVDPEAPTCVNFYSNILSFCII